MFQDLPKLQHLQIRNYFREPEKQKQFRNRFKGSLKPLRTSPKLEELHINNTDISSGLEYLPENVELVIYCSAKLRPESLCKELLKELAPYEKEESLPNKEQLEELYMQKSIKFSDESTSELDFLKDFKGLVELNIEYCPFEGSLKHLSELKNLKRIYISHTDLREGIEDLPESCKEIYCDFHYKSKHKSIKIAKELERLYVIRVRKRPRITENSSELGGGLLLVGQSDTEDPNSQLYTQTGGVIAIAAPFIETLTSYVNEQVYDDKQRRWDEFERDVENLWDNFYELIGIIEPVKDSFQGKAKVDKALSDL
ncbi:7878_t:CDS:2 [Paraglomus brasilianum]|uniref:7878_t:CDS:1 n=1 Tax=Paraglomus brasilianum TaxID=144538 RepID=A0A9N9CGH9_9GLOM|nr:7878_t:CDS:2 [Paraglomus brasilianum]